MMARKLPMTVSGLRGENRYVIRSEIVAKMTAKTERNVPWAFSGVRRQM